MNVIEKIQLVQEINKILYALDSQRLSFFEIAKSRQRLKQIYKLCDDPIFHKQQASLQALLEPKALALAFAKDSAFYDSYQGFFIRENALKTQIISGWALLQNASQEWKAWLIFSDEGYVASSTWQAQLKDVLPWLEQQYEQRRLGLSEDKATYLTNEIFKIDSTEIETEKNLNTEPYVQPDGAPLTRRFAYQNTSKILMGAVSFSEENIPSNVDLGKNVLPNIEAKEIADVQSVMDVQVKEQVSGMSATSTIFSSEKGEDDALTLNLGQPIFRAKAKMNADTLIQTANTSCTEDAEEQSSTVLGAIDLGDVQPAISLNLGSTILASMRNLHPSVDVVAEPALELDAESPTSEERVEEQRPEELKKITVTQYQGRLQRLSSAFTDEPDTYALQLERAPITEYLELLVYSETEQDVSHLPIYIAEQVNLQERLSQYVVLFGAYNAKHALKIIKDYVTHTSNHLLSVCEVDWQTFSRCFLQFESFTQMYLEQEQIIWRKDGYLPYIPVDLIHVIKMLPFEERAAQFNTPILLLNDRLKLRLIHGKNRINLSKNESAYPALIFDRKDGVSWQLVKTALSQLPTPIDVYQLHKKIQELVQLQLA